MKRRTSHMRPFWLALFCGLAAFVAVSCGEDGDRRPVTTETETKELREWGARYVTDPQVGRDALEDSLVESSNGYASLRLQKYGPDREWDQLPVVDRPVRPIEPSDIGAIERPWDVTEGEFRPLGALADWSHEGVMSYGRRAFMSYPLGADGTFQHALDSDADTERFGLWRADGRVGGIVRARLGAESEVYAPTCSTCHASVDDAGTFAPGRPNADFDYDAMLLHGASGAGVYPMSRWGAGSVDVTSDGVMNPVAMADLRAVRHQRNLHWAATIRNSFPALVVRIETLIITSLDDARPAREIPFAIAYYLWNLGRDGVVPAGGEGARHFQENCASCHGADGSVGPPVAVEVVGTDDAVARSTSRGLSGGVYRVPSLWKVGTRGQFLHDGQVGSLEELFDPVRLDRVDGHVFGTQLDVAERSELIDFVRQIGADHP